MYLYFNPNAYQNQNNTIYNTKADISRAEDLQAVATYDHTAAYFTDYKRGNGNYIKANCLIMDIDNDHTEDPGAFISGGLDIMADLPGVCFYTATSRNNGKAKNGTEPRPRFHVYFPLQEEITDPVLYSDLKKELAKDFVYYDNNALDASRFIYGNNEAIVKYFPGLTTIDAYIKEKRANAEIKTDQDENKSKKEEAGGGNIWQYERTDTDPEDIKSALDAIDPKTLDYAAWLKVGMALKAGGAPVDAWAQWSEKDPDRYKQGEALKKWASFRKDDGNKITIASLFEMAKAYGWKPKPKDATKTIAETLPQRTGAEMLADFMEKIKDQSARTYEPIPTGIQEIDEALQGGFIRQTLVTLGAPPAMGKTALAQWIFENMAKQGQSVLYINLEMARAQLLARSLGRIAWQLSGLDVSPLQVLRGYEWTQEEADAINQAAQVYRDEIANNFIYNPDGLTNNIKDILATMEAETNRLKAQGKKAPLICIDYLQLIDFDDRDETKGLKNVIALLKDFAKKYETVVFCIVANNRASNKSGAVDMESGRDTSAIEYTGDYMLGLSYTAIEDRFLYENEKGKQEPYNLEQIRHEKREAYNKNLPTYKNGKIIPYVWNEISLKVLKSRFTEAERQARFIFDGKHSTFEAKPNYKAQDFNGKKK